MNKIKVLLIMLLAALFMASPQKVWPQNSSARFVIITSDTLLADMARTLLPAKHFSVEAILPPGQCPGHYDIKLSDIKKVQKADLVIFFQNAPFLEKTGQKRRNTLVIYNQQKNWMAPDSYIFGLNYLADELARRFPQQQDAIFQQKSKAVWLVQEEASKLQLQTSRFAGQAVLASFWQKETLEWMGFRVAGVYGRPESLSVKELARLLKIGKEKRVIAIVDNLQSGPDTGQGIAQTLGRPHLVLNNFPTGQGYLTTLRENVQVLLTALEHP